MYIIYFYPYLIISLLTNDCEDFFAKLENLSLPLGRLDKTQKENIYTDYAHSPKALESVCKYLFKRKKVN